MHARVKYRAQILPVSKTEERPLWSIMIPTYHCAQYLRKTLESVLSQEQGPAAMQIEVVDDHSVQDDPESVVEDIGQGRVAFYRQPENVGHTRNFETCLQRSRGRIIHLLHGDDFVLDGFYNKMQHAMVENAEIGAAYCRHYTIDEKDHILDISPLERGASGELDNWLPRIAKQQWIQTPSIVVRREVYEILGAFDRRLAWTEDWEMWVRIAAHYPMWYEVEPLAAYRTHSNSNTARYVAAGENVRDYRRAIDIMGNYLKNDHNLDVRNTALEQVAIGTFKLSIHLMALRKIKPALIQFTEALRCSTSRRATFAALRCMTLLPVAYTYGCLRTMKTKLLFRPTND